MPRTKLKKFSMLNEMRNVFDIKKAGTKESLHNYFNNGIQFTLEIGCGHGDYSIDLAQKFPERNFIGIDVKGSRIFHGAMRSIEMKLNNVAFVSTRAEKLNQIFVPNSIEEIYLPFPDPHLRRASQNKRLISPPFLKIYKELLVDSGLLHLKTDNHNLYEYTIASVINSHGKIIHSSEDLHNDSSLKFNTQILTNFEKHYINQGRKIKYICFNF